MYFSWNSFTKVWSHIGAGSQVLFSASDLMEAVRGHFCLLIIRANSRTTPKCLISSFINLHLSSKIYKNFNKWDSLKIINLHRMAGMNKTMLTVSNDKNLKLNFTKNGDLIYKGRFFSKVINTMKLILHLIILIYSQLKNQWHHLWTRHFFSEKLLFGLRNWILW